MTNCWISSHTQGLILKEKTARALDLAIKEYMNVIKKSGLIVADKD